MWIDFKINLWGRQAIPHLKCSELRYKEEGMNSKENRAKSTRSEQNSHQNSVTIETQQTNILW